MSSILEKYTQAFCDAFDIDAQKAVTLKFQEIPEWDSVGHMGLVAEIEGAFDIMLEPDDIVNLSSFDEGKKILKKYEIDIE